MGRRVIVIGGGASGMMAAVWAAREGACVTVLEHMDKVGKKILSTGNGRCNLTNRNQSAACYRSGQPDFPMKVIGRFPVDETLEFFMEIGVLPKSRDGYVYPNSDQASAVTGVLRMEMERRGVQVVCGCRILDIRRKKQGFSVLAQEGSYEADALVLAAGSKAAPATGSDGSGYELGKKLGHRIITPLPALVQLRCKEKHYKQLAGIRTEARLTLLIDGSPAVEETGELQLTDYGISGIPTFQISRYGAVALEEKKEVKVRIDFLPNQSVKETEEFVGKRVRTMGYKTCEDWAVGFLNRKLAAVLLKLAGIHLDEKAADVAPKRWSELVKQLKAYETVITAVNPYENAQVCCGGIDTGEVSPETMESKLVPGLYLAGELLDVDGICGGYNLQWAWSSGKVAGSCAGKGVL